MRAFMAFTSPACVLTPPTHWESYGTELLEEKAT
jgi:hypothetical protein